MVLVFTCSLQHIVHSINLYPYQTTVVHFVHLLLVSVLVVKVWSLFSSSPPPSPLLNWKLKE